MLQKWSEKEDEDLVRLIKKYGTGDWALIRRHFKSHRTRDSVIKRWHGKLKLQKNNANIEPIEEIKPKPAQKKKNQDKQLLIPPKSKYISKSRGAPISVIANQKLRSYEAGKKEDEISDKNEQISKNKEERAFVWSKQEDQKLKELVLRQGFVRWSELASIMGCSDLQARKRWKKTIYSTIILDDKVGGFNKYSHDEDNILLNGVKNGLSWQQLVLLLPGRSQFSIEARWRRLMRPQAQVQLSKNRHFTVRQFLKKILQKKRSQKEFIQDNTNLI